MAVYGALPETPDLRRRLAMYKIRFRAQPPFGKGTAARNERTVSFFTRKVYGLMYKLRLLSPPSLLT